MASRIEERARDLEDSEERFRSLASLVPAFVWFADSDGNIHYLNDRWYAYTGQTSAEALPLGWANVVHPSDAERTLAAWRESVASGSLYEVEVRYRRHDGAYRWFLARAEPLRNEAGEIKGWFGSSTDIDAIKRAEQHRVLLINELNHRVKNTLATVQSVAMQTFRSDNTSKEARVRFEARLMALSKAQDVLTRENWEGAELAVIIQDAVEPHCGDNAARLTLKGPAVELTPQMALAFAMALHELCTNAAKYGAFSVATGRVTVEWLVVISGGERRLHLKWQESGGPGVSPPTRRGFGSRLIERGLAKELNGEVRLSYEPSGVICTVDVPIPKPHAYGPAITAPDDAAEPRQRSSAAS
jgi:PAS domain S-box-containing protein